MDVLIFLVRLLFSALLYVFLGVLFIWLWRDIKAATRPQLTASARERPSRLRVLRGSNGLHEGVLLPLEPFTTIGRAESNTIVITDPYASGEHALLAWRSGQWWLEDRDSRNGTLVNDIPVEEPLIISHGDVIGIGQVQFRFEYSDLETIEQTHTVNTEDA
jgi:pSer/pThr/pTyr-binding forkhead associated (FHA) protein